MDPDKVLKEIEPWVNYTARAMTRGSSSAEDLAQEGMLGAWEAIKNSDPSHGGSFLGYLKQKVRWKMLEHLSGNRRWTGTPPFSSRNSKSINPEYVLIEDIDVHGMPWKSNIESIEFFTDLFRNVQLTAKQREIIFKRCWEDQTLTQPERNVWSYALPRLKEYFG